MPAAAREPSAYSFAIATCATRQLEATPWQRGLADPGDLFGAANLAWVESAQRWDPLRASLTTYAWRRMHGRVRDCLRGERRFRRLQRRVAANDPEAAYTPAWTEPLALRQAIEASRPAMTPTEQLVLQRVYSDGGTLVEVAEARGASIYSIERAHQRLLERLRGTVAGKPVGRGALGGAARELSAAQTAAVPTDSQPDPQSDAAAEAPSTALADEGQGSDVEALPGEELDFPW